MEKEELIERLMDREEFMERRSNTKDDKDSRLMKLQEQNAVYHQYFLRALDVIEKAEKNGVLVDDKKLENYLKISEGGFGTSQEAAEADMKRRKELLSKTLKGTVLSPVKKVADWTKWGFFLQLGDFIIGGLILGFLAIYVPHLDSKEPIEVRIIEQVAPQNQSESTVPENANVVVVTESL